MGKNIGGYILAGVGGAVLAWATATLFRTDPAESGTAVEPAPAMKPAEPRAAREPAEPAAVSVEPAQTAAQSGNNSVPTAARSAPAVGATRNPIVDNAPPASRGTVTDLPSRHDNEPDHARPADELLSASRITCEFGAGNNTGMRQGELLTVGGGAQWVGGLIVYDLLGAAPGEARLSGSPGATGTMTGETKVQLQLSGPRLTFLGELPNGVFLVTTIYAELDDVGRHVAVMSRHEQPGFTYAGQFLGTCQ